MHALKRWLKTSFLLLLCATISLGFCAPGWASPSPVGWIANLPPGNAVTDPQTLLRLALPIDNQPVRQIQASLEDISDQVRGKRWKGINGDISKAIAVLNKGKTELLASVPEAQKPQAETLIDQINTGLTSLKAAAEAKDKERLVQVKSDLLTQIGELEAYMVQKFPFEVPAKYSNLPQLKGRATVLMETSKGPVTIVVDGYSAPITAGNFVDLVQRGFYNGLEFTRAEQSYVLQAGDPPGPEQGFVDAKTGKYRAIPLEILVKGDAKPLYGITLEDAGRFRDQPVLPFAAYGTVALARPGDDPNGGSSQFFFLLFEPELTPAGLNLLDGRYAVFGYVVEGEEVLGELKQGDKIESARVIQGADQLVEPQVA
jgi:peptidylprolyl isomerase